MIEVKEAIQRARNYLIEVFNDEAIDSVRLEEVELTEDDRFWLITLSFLSTPSRVKGKPPKPPLLVDPERGRVFKRLTVDASSGEVKSMKIRVAG